MGEEPRTAARLASAAPARIELSRPWFGEAERQRISQALAQRTAGDGPFGRRVEERLEHLLQVPRVLLATSCTHALELALLALGIGPGDEVVVPSFTFVSTANAVLRVGARPVFADIEEGTLGLDPDDVARVLGPRTRALVPVHYAGVPPDMDRLLAMASEKDLKVVEDAAHALGATWNDRALGTLGDAGTFSFHETKNVTCGEGGALALRDPELVRKAEVIREKGTNRGAFLRGETDKYTWVSEGSSYVLSDVLAAILDAQLDRFDEIQRRRARVEQRYRDGLAGWADAHGVRLAPAPTQGRPSHHLFFLLFPHAEGRTRSLAVLKERGVAAAFHYVPLHSSPQARALGAARDLPVTDRVASTLLRLPLHPLLTDDEVERVLQAVRESLS